MWPSAPVLWNLAAGILLKALNPSSLWVRSDRWIQPLATDPNRIGRIEEVVEVVVQDIGVDQFPALAVHDADVYLTRMQIDSAVVFGRGRVIFHSV